MTIFLKIPLLHVVLDWQKIYQIVLEKAIFSILLRFYPFLVLQRGELEIGHIRHKKIANFMLIKKKQTCLGDKMPPTKDKKYIKKGISKI